jgi:hypothetical protein
MNKVDYILGFASIDTTKCGKRQESHAARSVRLLLRRIPEEDSVTATTSDQWPSVHNQQPIGPNLPIKMHLHSTLI